MSNDLKSTVLITGSQGFIGRHLCAALRAEGITVREFVRTATIDLDNLDALQTACMGVDTVFHCAGYAHALDTKQADDAADHWRINYEGTRNLCHAASVAGVQRLVFASSVKAIHADTPYGQAKRAAEDCVRQLGITAGIHVVNLRLAMVYGTGGKGNLQRMAQLIARGLFPPLPETHNQRSMVHVDDLVRAMRCCAISPQAHLQTLTVAHSHAPSGRELYDTIREVLGLRQTRIFIPRSCLMLLASFAETLQRLTRRQLPFNHDTLAKLLDSEVYDAQPLTDLTGWQASVSLPEGLRDMLAPYKKGKT